MTNRFLHKGQLQIDGRPQHKVKSPLHPNLKEEGGENMLRLYKRRKDFLNRTLVAQALRPTVDKWDLVKSKNTCVLKDAVIQVNDRLLYQVYTWQKVIV